MQTLCLLVLNSDGKIADLLINSRKKIQFIAPEFLRFEISKHHSKISRLSGLTIGQIREAEYQICREIIFYRRNKSVIQLGLMRKRMPLI
jgi:hypothetical protein